MLGDGSANATAFDLFVDTIREGLATAHLFVYFLSSLYLLFLSTSTTEGFLEGRKKREVGREGRENGRCQVA